MECIALYRNASPNAGEKGRKMLMIFIESGERELKEVKNILESI